MEYIGKLSICTSCNMSFEIKIIFETVMIIEICTHTKIDY